MGESKDLKDSLGNVSETVEAAINLGQEAAEQERIEQWTEQGREVGEAQAEADFASGNWRMNPINAVEIPTDPGIAPGSTFDPVEVPSFVNPLLTGLEVAFTPSELNVGEFAQRDAFQAGADDGYRDGMFNAFDKALDDRLAAPPPEPEPEAPSAIDCLIPPLVTPPETDWSDCAQILSDTSLGSSASSSNGGSDSGLGSPDDGGSGGSGGGSSDSGSSD